jgi:carbamoyltransferase
MYILGISCYYHDSSATLMKDGKIIAASQEERFTRIKHDNSFPISAIKFCLDYEKIDISDIDMVGFYEKPLSKFERVLYQFLESFPKSFKLFLKVMPQWFNFKLKIIKTIRKKLKYEKDILFIKHHLSHAANFFQSSFDKAAIVTSDGVGEWTTTAYGYGENNRINLLEEIKFPSSLGLFYSTITAYLGFRVNNSEYKVMGLASYGNQNKKTNKYFRLLKKIINIKPDGSYNLDMSFFEFHFKEQMFSEKLNKLLGKSKRLKDQRISSRHKDIAAALQIIYEEVLFKILNYVHKKTNQKNLVLSGGTALNSVANGKIIANTGFENMWIAPDPGDGGASMGVTEYIYHEILNKKRKVKFDDPYLGPEFSNEFIQANLVKKKLVYTEYNNEKKLIDLVSTLLKKNFIVGWFQGRMEWGPRALGSRSILANPLNPNAKEILNSKIKFREIFRPFAPVVCKDDANKYFDCDNPIPDPTQFMLMVYQVRKKWIKKIKSVVHIDDSVRLQVITRNQNKLYYDLIKEFGKKTGIPMLINTSFNVSGEPIVCTPNDAIKTFLNSGMDYLVIGNYLVSKKYLI